MSRWTVARARAWYEELPWIVGCNFFPSNASNQLEMWQEESFDPARIELELGWAASLGMNSVRVYLHDLLWEHDAAGFRARIDRFLSIADKHGISTLLTIFDDCWHDGARLGVQEPPIAGIHNSRWLMSPGAAAIADRRQWPRLEAYVRGVVSAFGRDRRVLAWDLYNEVGNRFMPTMTAAWGKRTVYHTAMYVRHVLLRSPSLDLMDAAFEWARAEKPEQPLTSCVYFPFPRINRAVLAQSDVVSFHHYEPVASLERLIAELRAHGRPLICTEWMARPRSRVETHLPVFHRENIGCFTWGLVAGKTNTIYAWSDVPSGFGPVREPDPWFHDLLREDGAPYREAEARCFRDLTQRGGERTAPTLREVR